MDHHAKRSPNKKKANNNNHFQLLYKILITRLLYQRIYQCFYLIWVNKREAKYYWIIIVLLLYLLLKLSIVNPWWHIRMALKSCWHYREPQNMNVNGWKTRVCTDSIKKRAKYWTWKMRETCARQNFGRGILVLVFWCCGGQGI